MKPAPFSYYDPTTVEEVVGLFADYGDQAKVLAGGQSLMPMLALRLAHFDHLIDLNRVDGLDRIIVADNTLVIGAMVRQSDAERSPVVQTKAPLLARALPLIGHFQIRNRGTVGGSVAHADPASELPAVMTALGATLVATGPEGTRCIPAERFFVSTWETTLSADEILTSIELPILPTPSGFAVKEVARRHGDFALAGAVVALSGELGVRRAAISLFGVGRTPVQAVHAAEALAAGAEPAEVARLAILGIDPVDDLHATGAYRRQVAASLVEESATLAQAELDSRTES